MLRTLQNILSGWTPQIINVPSWLSNIIDILAVAFGIYKIMQWIRETRAWSLFKGVIIVLLLYAISSVLNLISILWALRMTFNIGLIMIVVLFQPELRKALEQLGKGRFLTSFIKIENNSIQLTIDTIEEICKAVFAMAAVKTGALIVLERNVALGDLVATGISLEAIVTNQLLINIFEHNTPLHDGAVIIRSNKVSAAGCFLPLTQEEIGKELGTRHRAAVGASEVSDAIVLAVSEETGMISIAVRGKLYREFENVDQLRRALFLYAGVKKTKKNKLITQIKRSAHLIL